jgi:hypothetical protein
MDPEHVKKMDELHKIRELNILESLKFRESKICNINHNSERIKVIEVSDNNLPHEKWHPNEIDEWIGMSDREKRNFIRDLNKKVEEDIDEDILFEQDCEIKHKERKIEESFIKNLPIDNINIINTIQNYVDNINREELDFYGDFMTWYDIKTYYKYVYVK